MTQPELPLMPEPPQPRPTRHKPGLRASKATTSNLCDDCCALIHQFGIQVAPFPRGGRWRVTNGEWVHFLCDSHKHERMGANE